MSDDENVSCSSQSENEENEVIDDNESVISDISEEDIVIKVKKTKPVKSPKGGETPVEAPKPKKERTQAQKDAWAKQTEIIENQQHKN